MRTIVCLLVVLLASPMASAMKFGTYFPAWAQYRHTVNNLDYKYLWSDFNSSDVVRAMDYVIYSFAYMDAPNVHKAYPNRPCKDFDKFDGTTFQVYPIETQDVAIWESISEYKAANSGTKVLFSIGGWNYPSADFSLMASTAENRQKFIKSVQRNFDRYGFDGLDIDWETPNSAPRVNPVKITCYKFLSITDPGGQPSDFENFVTLMKELREAVGPDKVLSISAPASVDLVSQMHIDEMSKYVDIYNLMDYDYFVSDIADDWGKSTLPNQPVYGVPAKPEFSVTSTINAYIAGGAKRSQLSLGLAYYGHTWNIGTGFTGTSFAKYGIEGKFDNGCCGPFGKTYGAKCGPVIRLCGTLGYSEITQVYHDDFIYVEDEATKTSIGYNSKDGVWVSFNSQKALFGIVELAKKENLGGIFLFDISMDTKSKDNKWDYKLSNSLCHQIIDDTSRCPADEGCLNDCSSHGQCSKGVCTCDSGYGGDDCSFFFCAADTDCTGHGECDSGVCKCQSGWFGSKCDKKGGTSCADPSFNGFSCEDDVRFDQCAGGQSVAKFSCPGGTTCQCKTSLTNPCGTSTNPAMCVT